MINQIVLSFIWVVTAFSYYLNNTFIKYVPGSFEDNYLMVNFTDALAALVSGYVFQYMDKPRLLFFTYSAIGVFAGSYYLVFSD